MSNNNLHFYPAACDAAFSAKKNPKSVIGLRYQFHDDSLTILSEGG